MTGSAAYASGFVSVNLPFVVVIATAPLLLYQNGTRENLSVAVRRVRSSRLTSSKFVNRAFVK